MLVEFSLWTPSGEAAGVETRGRFRRRRTDCEVKHTPYLLTPYGVLRAQSPYDCKKKDLQSSLPNVTLGPISPRFPVELRMSQSLTLPAYPGNDLQQ